MTIKLNSVRFKTAGMVLFLLSLGVNILASSVSLRGRKRSERVLS